MKDQKPPPRPPLSEKVYHLLLTRISNGDYQANQKLPTEAVLSQDFGVSRPVLRAAMERLRDEGLIYSRQGAGSFARPPVSAGVGYARVETLADIQRCYEFRILLEGEAASLAAQRCNAAGLAEIDRALHLLQDATGSFQHREDADFAFHLAIGKASNNQYFDTTMRALRDHINTGMRLHGQSLMSDGAKGLQDVLAEHSAIRDAIAAGDAPQATRQMRAHLEHSRDRLFGGGLIDLRHPDG